MRCSTDGRAESRSCKARLEDVGVANGIYCAHCGANPAPSGAARVFGVDPLRFEHCDGQMKITATVIQNSKIKAVLKHSSLPNEPPEAHRARGPTQARLWADDEGQAITDG